MDALFTPLMRGHRDQSGQPASAVNTRKQKRRLVEEDEGSNPALTTFRYYRSKVQFAYIYTVYLGVKQWISPHYL